MNATHIRRCQAATLAGLLLSGLSAEAASAARLHDPDLTAQAISAGASSNHTCWLARVGTQFVRCDDLTGNAVQAPLWVPEQ
jgi:hypothetical protein